MNHSNFRSQGELFGFQAPAQPDGLRYQPDFLSADEEAELIRIVASLPLQEMQYKSYTARRRIVSYGGRYDFNKNTLLSSEDLVPELEPLRAKVATWLAVPPSAFTQILVAEYRPGTSLGWHRDVPDFEDIVGISLSTPAILRFRPYPAHDPRKSDIIRLTLEPRSIYLLRGAARWAWQHSVAPTASLRYSLTFRTRAQRRNEPRGRED